MMPYSWSKGNPTVHYVAIVLSGTNPHPIFIDLFDEEMVIFIFICVNRYMRILILNSVTNITAQVKSYNQTHQEG